MTERKKKRNDIQNITNNSMRSFEFERKKISI